MQREIESLLRVTAALVATLAVAACASSPFPSLEPELPDAEPDGFRFFHGGGHYPDYIYAFQLTPDGIFVVDSSDDPKRTYELSNAECPSLAEQHAKLLAAVAETVKMAAGESPIEEPDEIILDGPTWRLEYWSLAAMTFIELKGNDNSDLVTPWVGAALETRSIATACFDQT